MKKIEVTIYTRRYSTYEVEVEEDFVIEGSAPTLEQQWHEDNIFGWVLTNEDIDTAEIDSIVEVR